MLAQLPASVSPGRPPENLDRVELQVDVDTEAGRLPRGATGTVVMVWEAGFGVEFTRPFPALVNLSADQVTIASHA